MDDIGNESIHTYYYKLSNKSHSNRKEIVKLDILYIISDPVKFSHSGFRGLNHNKRYELEVKNIKIRLNKPKKIVYTQKLIIIGW